MNKPKLSIIIPCTRPKMLKRTLRSIPENDAVEIVVVFDGSIPEPDYGRDLTAYVFGERQGGWGGPARNKGMSIASGEWLTFMDDDDYYAPYGVDIMLRTIAWKESQEISLPLMFRMNYVNGNPLGSLWRIHRPEVYEGNVSTPMICVPNDRTKLGTWTTRLQTDYDFIKQCQDNWGKVEFVPYATALITHTPGTPALMDAEV